MFFWDSFFLLSTLYISKNSSWEKFRSQRSCTYYIVEWKFDWWWSHSRICTNDLLDKFIVKRKIAESKFSYQPVWVYFLFRKFVVIKIIKLSMKYIFMLLNLIKICSGLYSEILYHSYYSTEDIFYLQTYYFYFPLLVKWVRIYLFCCWNHAHIDFFLVTLIKV